MGKFEKALIKILRGTSDKNISFSEICTILKALKFSERIKGDHHIFTREDIVEIVNIQSIGSKAKAYQVKQIRNIILKYKLTLGDIDV
jgi:hypothetical protein